MFSVAHEPTERTKLRPLANGDITPSNAIIFLGGQLSLGLAVLTQLNLYRCVPEVRTR
jgi:4-hydroxybenzoate polyprenyltransferase